MGAEIVFFVKIVLFYCFLIFFELRRVVFNTERTIS